MSYSLNEITGGEHSRRVKEGMAMAADEGRHAGRPRLLTPAQVANALKMKESQRLTWKEAASLAGVAESTLRSYWKEAQHEND